MTEEYQNTLRLMTPSRYSLSSNGRPVFPYLRFSEANLVSSFLRNYQEQLAKGQCTIWQEYPFREDNKAHSGHIDGLIIDRSNKALIFIEAKRLDKRSKLATRNESTRNNSLVEDYQRIAEDLSNRHNSRLLALLNQEEMKLWNIHIVLLVDATYQGWAKKSGFLEGFSNKNTNLLYKAIKDSKNEWIIGSSPRMVIYAGENKPTEYIQGYLSCKIL